MPKKSLESLVYKLITTNGEDDIIPPIYTDKNLTKKEKEIIYKWIKSGAKYEENWSFVKPLKPELLKLKNSSWLKADINHYVLANLEKKGLEQWEVTKMG